MIPFPGESIGIRNTYPAPIENDVYGRDGSATIASGEEWRIWVRGTDSDYLEDAGTPVVVSWVVEVLSGSGTLTFHEGTDATGTDIGAAVPNDLGSRAVTGASTLVVTSTFTASDIMLATPQMVLALACTAGSVQVQQVKMRVWPPGGALGGWVEHPGFTTPPALSSITGAFVERSTVTAGPMSPPSDAWDATMAATAGGASTGGTGPHTIGTDPTDTTTDGGTTWRTAAPDVAPYVDILASLDTLSAEVSATPHGLVVVLTGPDPTQALPISDSLVEDVDWIRPPNEVRADDLYFAQQLGTATVAWDNAVATLVVEGATDPPDAGPSLSSSAPASSPVSGGDIALDIVEGGASVTMSSSDVTAGVALVDSGRWVAVTVSHSIAADAPPWPGLAPFAGLGGYSFGYVVHFGAGTPGPTFSPMTAHLNMPAYEVWNPTAAVLTVLRHGVRNDGRYSTGPRRWGQQSSTQSGRWGGYQ